MAKDDDKPADKPDDKGPDPAAALKAKVKELEEASEKLLDDLAKVKQENDTLSKVLNRAAGGKPAGEKAKKSWLRKLLVG